MPPVIATNGRRDASIPWVNNPPFYQGANAARQAFSVYWNNGNHGMTSQSPQDVRARLTAAYLRRYRLDRSFPAFSNSSDNRNYGNGDPSDGDEVGWINRGFDWEILADTPDRYAIRLSAAHPEIVYPVTADVTFRRRQHFKFPAGTRLKAVVGGVPRSVGIDGNGLLTVEKVVFADARPLEVSITR